METKVKTKVEDAIVINRPPHQVFSYLFNPVNLLQWHGSVMECNLTLACYGGVGSTFGLVHKFLGKYINTTYIITEFEVNRLLCCRSISGPVILAFSLSLEPVFEGTKLNCILEKEILEGLFPRLNPILYEVMEHQFQADLKSLKFLLEN